MLPCRAQKTITLPGYKRGCHVVTRKLMAELPEVEEFEVGLANFFSTSHFYLIAVQYACQVLTARFWCSTAHERVADHQ